MASSGWAIRILYIMYAHVLYSKDTYRPPRGMQLQYCSVYQAKWRIKVINYFLVSISPTHSSTLPHQCNEAKSATSCTTPQMSTTNYRLQSQTPVKSVKTGESVLALIGALLGLSVVLLAVVTTGWVCTCVYMKSKLAMDQSQQTR